MASDGQTWQDGKCLSECNKYMLTNSVSTDVTFEIGENRQQVPAHKYVLGSRSSVFYAMLFGPMAESNDTISIPDIELDVFQEILGYLYYEEVNITMHNVTSLMFAADKYNIISVINKCAEFLFSNVTVETVCNVLDIAVTLRTEELKNKCLDIIFKNSEEVFQSSSICDLQRESLKLIIESDELNASETLIYESVKKWAETQCRTNSKDICDSSIREMIGDMKSLIRFTIMDKDDFAKIVSTGNILTSDEKIQVFQVHRDINLKREDVFCCTNRRVKDECVCVNAAFNEMEQSITLDSSETLRFMVSEKIHIKGYALCGSLSKNTYNVEANLFHDDTLLADVSTTRDTTDGKHTFQVHFKSGVLLEPNIWYTANVQIKGPLTLSCCMHSESLTVENVTFRFDPIHVQQFELFQQQYPMHIYYPEETFNTPHHRRHIPGIVFHKYDV